MNDDKEPKFWVTAVKVAAGVVVVLTLIGLGLYYTAKFNTYEPPNSGGSSNNDWGISKDSPIHFKR